MNGPLPDGAARAGRYEIKHPLGGGGMGDVFAVFDPVRRRDVALKVLKFTYPRALHYFKREFRAIARLRHRNLVTLYDLHAEEGRYFYTMELVDGVDLYVHVNGSNLVVDDPDVLSGAARQTKIRHAIVQILRALAHLHDHGFVHRDLKPSNIMVDTRGVVKILDFGIVKELLPGNAGQSLSQIFGTATYMSPEQSQGSRVGPASDMYAAGVVLYELLAGVPPFDGDPQVVIAHHRHHAPPSLVQRVPAVQPALALVCMALLEKNASERPSAHEALEMLGERSEAPIADDVEFVGRRQARKALHEALEGVRDGRGALVVLEGQSGAGKTALINAFAAQAGLWDAALVTGVCVHRDHVAARGLDTIVERIAEAWRRRVAEITRAIAPPERAALISTFPFLGELLPKPLHANASETAPGGPRAGAGLATLLTELARKRLLIIALEQLHLADDVTLDLLESLQSGGRFPPVLMFLTVRPEAVLPGSRVARLLELLDAHPHARRLPVLPLLPNETQQLAESLLDDLSTDDADRIHQESGGDPLFVHALIHAKRRAPDSPPPRLDDLVRDRVARLDFGARHVLQTIALSRVALSGDVLMTATGLEADALYEALDELDAEELVRAYTDADGAVTVSPVHARWMSLVRQYQRPEDQTRRHVDLARALEAAAGDPAAIAFHWTEAGDPDRAPLYALQAAGEAIEAGHDGRAADLLALVVDRPPPGMTKATLLDQLSQVLARAGRAADAAAALQRALAEPDTEATLRGAGPTRLATLLVTSGQLAAYDRELPKLPRVPARAGVAAVLAPLDPERAEACLGDLQTPDALLVRAELALEGGDAQRGLARSAKALRDALAGPHGVERAALVRALALRAEGQLPDARAVLDEALDRLGPTTLEPVAARLRLTRVAVARDLGDLPGARQRARALYADPRWKGQPATWALVCVAMARAHLDAGEVMAAERRLVEAERIWPTDPPTAVTVEIALVRVLHQLWTLGPVPVLGALRRIEAHTPWAKLLTRREARAEVALLNARIAAVRAAKALRSGDKTAQAVARETLLETLKALREVLPPPVAWLQSLTALAECLGAASPGLVERLERFVPRPGEPAARSLAAALLTTLRTRPELAAEDLRQGQALLREAGAAPPPEVVHLGVMAPD